MLGPNVSLHALSIVAMATLVSISSNASASPASAKVPSHRSKRVARVVKAHECTKSPVEVIAGAESATFSLAKCDGSPIQSAVDELSVLARPGSTAKPKESTVALGRNRGTELAPGIRRIDARLVERLELVVDHFQSDVPSAPREVGRNRGNPRATRVVIVSGYRPRSAGSYHQTGRAIDFRLDGVNNEAVVAFCKTMPDTGCGFYPNSMFVHMDVRDRGAGHVSWIDASRPGEAPRYVSAAQGHARLCRSGL